MNSSERKTHSIVADNTDDLQFTKEELERLLRDLNARLEKRDVTGEICIFGGAVMILAWEARELTRDVDAVMKPPEEIKSAVRDVAGSNSLDKPVPADWLNDGVKGYIDRSPDPDSQKLVYDFSHLRVMRPPAEYLLAMKAQSARVGEEEKDRDDLEFIMNNTDIKDPNEVKEIVRKYYPERKLPAKVKFFIESVAEELNS